MTVAKFNLTSQEVSNEDSQAILRQPKVSRVLRKLGFFSLGEPGSSERDRAANILVGYIANLHIRFSQTVSFNKPIHQKAYDRFDSFFSRHHRRFKRTITENDVEALKPLFSKKLDAAPLGALLQTSNQSSSITNEEWEKLKYWAAYTCICFLMCHFRYVDVNNRSVLMPSISAGLRRLRLAQGSSRYQIVLHELSIPKDFKDFCEQWEELYESVNTKYDDQSEQLSHSIAGQNFNTLKLFFESFWRVEPSKRVDYITGRSKVTRSSTLDKPTRGTVERVRPTIRYRNIDKEQGEEVAAETREDYQLFETDTKQTSEFKSQVYLQHIKAQAIAASSLRNELGHPCSLNTIERRQLLQVLKSLDISERSQSRLSDAWLLLILITGQTHKTLCPALMHKEVSKNDLTISLTGQSITFINNRRLTSHLMAHQLGLLDEQRNVLRIDLPSSITEIFQQSAQKSQFITEKQLNNRLRTLCAKLELPVITSNQLAAWPFLYLSRRAQNRTAAAATFGMQPSEWTPLYYTNFDVSHLRRRHSKFYELLFNSASQFDLAKDFSRIAGYANNTTGQYGSTLRVREKRFIKILDKFRDYIKNLQWAYASGQHDYLRELHNAYTVYVLIYFQLQTAARPVAGIIESIGQLDFANKRIFLQDKEVRDGVSRIVPMTGLLERQLRDYIEYLAAAQGELSAKGKRLSKQFLSQLKGKENLFKFFEKEPSGQWRYVVLTNGVLAEYLKELLPLPLNFARHMVRNFLNDEKVKTEIIDDFMGHDMEGQMLFGKYSAHVESNIKPLISSLEAFANHISLERLTAPISLPKTKILLDETSGLPAIVAHEAVERRETPTEREKRLKTRQERDERVKNYVRSYIGRELPRLKKCDGDDNALNEMIQDAHEHIEAKYTGVKYYVAKEELVSYIDKLNNAYGRALDIGKLPTKIAREKPIRSMLSVNLADRAARLSELLINELPQTDELTDAELRCILVLISGLYGGLNSSAWLEVLLNTDFCERGNILSLELPDRTNLYWLSLTIGQSHKVNEVDPDGTARLTRQVFLTPTQLSLVTALQNRRSEKSTLKLSDIPKILMESVSLSPLTKVMFYESQKQIPVVQMLKYGVDFTAHHTPGFSVALRHTAMGEIDTFSLSDRQLIYALQPHLNTVEQPPSIEGLQVVWDSTENSRVKGSSQRSQLKKLLDVRFRNVNREITKILKQTEKRGAESKVKNALTALKTDFEQVEAVNFLISWLLSNMELQNNRISTVSRYHSAVTLNWLVATYTCKNLSALSGDEFYELYNEAIELTQPRTEEDIEIMAGEGNPTPKPELKNLNTKEEKAKERARNNERHKEQIARNKQKVSNQHYTRQCFQRFHNFLVQYFNLPRMPRDLVTMKSNRVEHIRVGFIPHKLYEAVIAKLPETKGCDDNVSLMLQCITILAYRTGLRISEILSLRLKDVTTHPDVWVHIKINEYAEVKRGSSARKVPLFLLLEPNEIKSFKNWLVRRKRNSRTNLELLFCYHDTPRVMIDSWIIEQSVVAWLRALSGMKSFVFHDFRHTALSCLQFLVEDEDRLYFDFSGREEFDVEQLKDSIFGGNNIRVDRYYALATFAGHANPSSTFKTYMHFSYLLTHLKLRRSNVVLTKSFVRNLSGLSDKMIANIIRGKKKIKRPSNEGEIPNLLPPHEGWLVAVAESERRYIRTVKQQSPITIESATDLMTIKPGPSEVHDILMCVTKGMSNEKISRDYEVPVKVVECYRTEARHLARKQTARDNRRLIKKQSKAKSTYLPSKPLTPKERKLARLYINGILKLAAENGASDVLELIEYFTNNVYIDEPGIRFDCVDKLNWFVDLLSPVISLRNWYIFVTTSKAHMSDIDAFINRLKITTKKPEVKIKKVGKPDFYLRLKHPNQDDLRRRGSLYQATSMLKYLLFMALIMLSAESEF
ncbi:tyrosine-type recombinase/integrase [Idiomarina zobellii]|uniref:tyrosine-type recombinase/integrase n=1 Tax=Idiomarina zobellii TaxID=86103 RepID=UPI000881AB53|nr:tyrosine-type recombinase/integrase [Idiomarina zobellii]SDG32993.1 Phage integrase family protein [Idiomarina zobellii]